VCSIIEGATFSDHELIPAGIKGHAFAPVAPTPEYRGHSLGITKM
jgi:hypothetical protein